MNLLRYNAQKTFNIYTLFCEQAFLASLPRVSQYFLFISGKIFIIC